MVRGPLTPFLCPVEALRIHLHREIPPPIGRPPECWELAQRLPFLAPAARRGRCRRPRADDDTEPRGRARLACGASQTVTSGERNPEAAAGQGGGRGSGAATERWWQVVRLAQVPAGPGLGPPALSVAWSGPRLNESH